MPTKDKKIVGGDPKKEDLIRNEWRAFAQTTAFKEMMEFGKGNSDMLTRYAKNLEMPGPDGKMHVINGNTSNLILQRSAGIDIMTSYVRLYVENVA